MKNKKGTVLMMVGALLLLASFIFTVYNLYEENSAEKKALDALSQIDLTPTEDNTGIPDYILNPDMPMPTVIIDEKEYIGVLEIPALGISLPVINECNLKNLKISPCLYQGSVYLDNIIIAGHNYKKHMGYINTLKVGDKIIFTDMDKNVFEYKVAETEIIDDTDVEGMVNGDDWDLTVFTCTYGGKKRVTVRAVKIVE